MAAHERDATDERELDEEFLRRLNRTLERQDIDECWHRGRSLWRRFLSELAKWLWYIAGMFCQIDLFGGRQEDPANRHYRRWSHHENFDKRFTRNMFPWWPYVSLPLYAYSSLRLIVNICYQYAHDLNFVRQQVFRTLTSGTNQVDVSSTIKAHLDTPFIQTILSAQERLAAAAAQAATGGTLPDSLMNFSSSIANASSGALLHHHRHYTTSITSGRQYHQPHSQQQRHQVVDPLVELGQLGALLDQRVGEAHAQLKRIGAPYLVMTFEVQIVYFILVASSFTLTILLKLYYHYVAPFNYALVRAVLDFKHERRLFNHLIVQELNRFILSSRNFTLACVEQSRWFAYAAVSAPEVGGHSKRALVEPEPKHEHERKKQEPRGLSREKAHARAEANRFLLDHALVKKQLQHMALGGQLLPEHRTACWVDALAVRFTGYAILSIIYIVLAILFFAFGFFAISDLHSINTSFMDLLVICEATILVVLVVPNVAFNIAILVATSIDQIHYTTSVCRRIRECIQLNQRRFLEILEMQQHQRELEASRHQRLSLSEVLGGNLHHHQQQQQQQQTSNFDPHYQQSSSSLSYGQLIDDSRRALLMGKQQQQQQQQQQRRGQFVRSRRPQLRQRSGSSSSSSRSAGSAQSNSTLSASAASISTASGTGGGQLDFCWRLGPRHAPSEDREDEADEGAGGQPAVQPNLQLYREEELRKRHNSRVALTRNLQNKQLDQSLGIEARCTQMNAELLRVFVTYKIFVAQMRQTTQAFVTFTLACLTLIIVSPTQVRLHSPYFSHLSKIVSMSFSLLGTTLVDSCLILLCYMFARCTEIYRGLSSLLAHAVEVMNHHPAHSQGHEQQQQQQQQQQPQQIYDTHTIWLLRKELNFPDRVVSQFAIVALDFRLTYSNLLKIHFWVGLLTLSIFVDDSSSQEFFGRLFNDPLGVFDWHPGWISETAR